MSGKGSAAWIVAIVASLIFITGTLLFTVLDPTMQAIFGSELWSSSTEQGSNALSWQKSIWLFTPGAVLLTILVEIWLATRQPT